MPPDPAWFEVSFVGQAALQTDQFDRRASAAGLSAERAATVGRITARLAADPRGVSDPLKHYVRLRLMLYGAIIDRVRVEFVVHDIRPVVFIRDISPVLDHPLRED